MAHRQRPPKDLITLLPDSDRRALAEHLDEGGWIVAGKYAMIVLAEELEGQAAGVVDSGMWYEIQQVRWEAATRRLTCVWVDPGRAPIEVTTDSEDPAEFMRDVTEKVNRTLITHRTEAMPNGTRVTAWVRRREDDQLFSVLTADGPLDEESQSLASRLEREVRESVGLD
ncbi:hypothetical protein G7Y41_02710 [Schaalia sp. ZJ405]|uniref:hypothetical protein n=1 Tax=unclassified Schaalia TaxID=2691889 RepID=UPI0013E9F043|nr:MULTISPECIES: hypothetical protein [unclassified Schaalia]QPK81762.1 hypothetical protein G7Y41_02710 [Schaalia sp. ZJ405]